MKQEGSSRGMEVAHLHAAEFRLDSARFPEWLKAPGHPGAVAHCGGLEPHRVGTSTFFRERRPIHGPSPSAPAESTGICAVWGVP
jgi:hypothetical protein